MALMPNATCMRDFGGLYQMHPLSPFSERQSNDDREHPGLGFYQMLQKSDRVACTT